MRCVTNSYAVGDKPRAMRGRAGSTGNDLDSPAHMDPRVRDWATFQHTRPSSMLAHKGCGLLRYGFAKQILSIAKHKQSFANDFAEIPVRKQFFGVSQLYTVIRHDFPLWVLMGPNFWRMSYSFLLLSFSDIRDEQLFLSTAYS